MQNCTCLVLLRLIFAKKMKTTPPKEFGFRSCEVVAVIRPEKPFDIPILAKKNASILVKIFFFFSEITCFWAEKPFEFPILAEKSVSMSDKPCDSDSRTMKILGHGCLQLSHSFKKAPPSVSNPGYVPAQTHFSRSFSTSQ